MCSTGRANRLTAMVRTRRSALALCLSLACGAAQAQAQALPVRYLGVELGFNEGDFGTALETRLYSARATVGLIAPDYDASLTLPVHRFEDDTGFSTHGMGDISAQLGHTLTTIGHATLSGTAYIKLPTADRDEGLGTGEVDYGGMVALATGRGDIRMRARAGFIVTGDPPGADYNDVVLYGVSVFGSAGNGGTGLYLSLDGRRATLEGVEDPLEVRIGAFRPLGARHAVSGDFMVGLSEGSADAGGHIGLVYWLD